MVTIASNGITQCALGITVVTIGKCLDRSIKRSLDILSRRAASCKARRQFLLCAMADNHDIVWRFAMRRSGLSQN